MSCSTCLWLANHSENNLRLRSITNDFDRALAQHSALLTGAPAEMMQAVLTSKGTADFRPTLLMLLAGVCWSFSGIFIKEIHWNAFAIAGIRSLIGGAMQFIFLLYCAGKISGGTPASISSVLKNVYLNKSKAHWIGAIVDVMNMTALVWAYQLTKAANAVFCHYGGFVLVALFSASILKQRLGRSDWTCIAIAMAGVALLAADGFDSHAIAGTLLGIFCCITFAVAQTCMGLRAKQNQSQYGAMETILLANTISFLISIPFVTTSLASFPAGNAWIFLLLLGILPWGLPDIMYTVAIKHVPVFRALILGLADPLLTAVWPMIFLGEIPSPMALLGAVMVSSAIVLQSARSILGTSIFTQIAFNKRESLQLFMWRHEHILPFSAG